MNWDAIGAIGEVVGAAGVLATLIYLSLQIRSQNDAIRTQNDAMQIQNIRSRASEMRSVLAMQATPESIEKAVEKAYATGESLNAVERHALEAYLHAFLILAECDFKLLRDGLITSDDWVPTKNTLELFFVSQAPRDWWERVANQVVSEEFRPEVESIIAGLEGVKNPYEDNASPNVSLEADA